jgi:uncharacterized membrane protein (DUF485 family)
VAERNGPSLEPGSADPELTRSLMARQAALGIRVAVVFLVLILGVPLVNQFLPELSQQPVFGFPLSWFVLGILFYPLTWALSAYFVKASERMEAQDAERLRAERPR